LHIAGKTQASIFNNDISLKTFFVVTKDINHTIIIGTPFIDMITPYQAHHNCITSKINNIKLVFPFLEKSNNSTYMIYKTLFLFVVSTNNYKTLIYKRKSLIYKIRLNNRSVQTYLMLSGKENNTSLIFLMKILFQKNVYLQKQDLYR
jgi:hypothetical protein